MMEELRSQEMILLNTQRRSTIRKYRIAHKGKFLEREERKWMKWNEEYSKVRSGIRDHHKSAPLPEKSFAGSWVTLYEPWI